MRFFFYGTLRSGSATPEVAPLLERSRIIGDGTIRGRLHQVGDYTGVIPDDSSPTTIPGEVVELPDDPALLARLDAYEGFDPDDVAGSPYVRAEVTVSLADGRRSPCVMYRYNRP